MDDIDLAFCRDRVNPGEPFPQRHAPDPSGRPERNGPSGTVPVRRREQVTPAPRRPRAVPHPGRSVSGATSCPNSSTIPAFACARADASVGPPV